MTIKRIKCQANHGDFIKGCSSCGGYGTIFEEVKLDCGHKYWSRPGAYSTYDGKIFTSLDGLKIICLKSGFMCVSCHEEGKGT